MSDMCASAPSFVSIFWMWAFSASCAHGGGLAFASAGHFLFLFCFCVCVWSFRPPVFPVPVWLVLISVVRSSEG